MLKLRHLVTLPTVASLAIIASACSDPVPATPRVFMDTTMGAGTEPNVNDPAKCGLSTQEWVKIGGVSTPVEDGQKDGARNVSVTCTVAKEGDMFNVVGNATLGGVGAITVSGKFGESGDQQNIKFTMQRGDTGTFLQNDCTANYEGRTNMGIAPGRVWFSFECKHAHYSSQDRTCVGKGEIRFENCAQ